MLPAPITTIGRGDDGSGQRCGKSVSDFAGVFIDALDRAMLACPREESTMAHTVTSIRVRDIRTSTSRTLAGSDAMHTDPDYSAAYVIVGTGNSDRLEGHGLTFTIGRRTGICVSAA